MSVAPVLAAYVLRSSPDSCLVWCPSCCVWHQHGTPEGSEMHRGSHCHLHGNNNSKYIQTGYKLGVVGEIDLPTQIFIRAKNFETHPVGLGLKIHGELNVKS